MSDIQHFLDQNPLCEAGMTADMIEVAEGYAEHHAGGLYVLIREASDDPRVVVKMHDSWGDDGKIVVHTYDPDDTDRLDVVLYFRDAVAAFDEFLGVEFDENGDVLEDDDGGYRAAEAKALYDYWKQQTGKA